MSKINVDILIRKQQWHLDPSFVHTLKNGKEKGFTDMDDYISKSKAYKDALHKKRSVIVESKVVERTNRKVVIIAMLKMSIVPMLMVLFLIFVWFALRNQWFTGGKKGTGDFMSIPQLEKTSSPQESKPQALATMVAENKDTYFPAEDYKTKPLIDPIPTDGSGKIVIDGSIPTYNIKDLFSRVINWIIAAGILFFGMRLFYKKTAPKPPPADVYVTNQYKGDVE